MTVSNGLCVVLGTVLGAGVMWVGMNTKTPQRPIHIQNQVVPPEVIVHVPPHVVSMAPQILVDTPPPIITLLQVQDVKTIEKPVEELPIVVVETPLPIGPPFPVDVPEIPFDEFGEELPPPTNLEKE